MDKHKEHFISGAAQKRIHKIKDKSFRQTATKSAAYSTGVYGIGAGVALIGIASSKKYSSYMPKKTRGLTAGYGVASIGYGAWATHKGYKMSKESKKRKAR